MTDGLVEDYKRIIDPDTSSGDKLNIRLGDRLLSGVQGISSTRPRSAEEISNFPTSVELETIGAYQFTNEFIERLWENQWSYGVGAVFVPSSLLPVEVPEDYKRVIDPDSPIEEGKFVLEGTYEGFEEYDFGTMYLLFRDITTYAGEIKFDEDRPLKIRASAEWDYEDFWSKQYPREFFEGIKEGSRCLVLGTYSEQSGSAFVLGTNDVYWDGQTDLLRVVDGLGDDYLETEEFAWYKEKIEARNQSTSSYDIVYTLDMRAIPYVNERRIVVAKGRPLTAGDTDACVVSELFLETYGLSIGDKIHIEFDDRLLRGRQGCLGTRYRTAEKMSDFVASAELEIIGAYRFTNDGNERFNDAEWSYGPATVFVPSVLLPVEVPEDHEIEMGDFSVFIENPRDIQAFREAAETWAADMDLGSRYGTGLTILRWGLVCHEE